VGSHLGVQQSTTQRGHATTIEGYESWYVPRIGLKSIRADLILERMFSDSFLIIW
jgi:hypothetical protein